MIDYLIELLKKFAEIVPLPIFTFLGALVEEVIAPIPSPVVMTLAGSFAAAEQQSILYLVFLAFVGTIGKTIGMFIVYIVSRTFENVVTNKFGKFIGITDKQVEKISAKLGKGWKDNVALFLLRAAPIVPTAPVSIVAGLLRLDLRTYLLSSAAGVFVRNVFYLYLGFTSVGALEKINENLDSLETIGYVIILLGIGGIIFYIWKKRREFDL